MAANEQQAALAQLDSQIVALAQRESECIEAINRLSATDPAEGNSREVISARLEEARKNPKLNQHVPRLEEALKGADSTKKQIGDLERERIKARDQRRMLHRKKSELVGLFRSLDRRGVTVETAMELLRATVQGGTGGGQGGNPNRPQDSVALSAGISERK